MPRSMNGISRMDGRQCGSNPAVNEFGADCQRPTRNSSEVRIRMHSMAIPEGWTDDMNVTIRTDRTILELTRAVMESVKKFNGEPEIVRATASEFGMSESDAWLAFDRVQGGIIRALTARLDNFPDRDKDPMAWHAFRLVWDTLPALHWWTGRKRRGGPWAEWHEVRRERQKQST